MLVTRSVAAMLALAPFALATPPDTLQIRSNNASLFTVHHPNANAETVILLHAGPGVPMYYTPVAGQLSRKYQAIAFDQRGTGRSPARNATFSIDEYLGDLNAITQHFGVDKVHLFGHSWGGLYAQFYAAKHPGNALSMFLSSPSSATGEHWQQTEREVMAFNQVRAGFRGWSKMGVLSLLGMPGSSSACQSLFKPVLENDQRDFDATFAATEAMVANVRAEPINKTRSHLRRHPLLEEGVQ